MYKVLNKDTIENKIVPHIPEQKRGFPPRVPLSKIISVIQQESNVQYIVLP